MIEREQRRFDELREWEQRAYMARVYIEQCRARHGNTSQRAFRFTLLQWAATNIARTKGLLRYAVPCDKCRMWHLQ